MTSRELLSFCFSLIFAALFSQTITGVITEAATGKPLESVAVYFDNTTLGTTTNSEGFFSIDYTDAIQTTLVISYLGFEKMYISNYRNREDLSIQLKEEANTLETVYLDYDDGLTRQQKLQIFRREFLGRSPFGKSCKILNESAIYLKYDKVEQVLTVSASEPILVENKALKYKISYEVVQFETVFRYINLETTDYTPESVIFLGTTFYKDLNDKQRKGVLKKRKTAYFGSVQHFMRSLYNKELTMNQFEIYHKGFKGDPWEWFTVQSIKNSDLRKVTLSAKVSILYGREQSELMLNIPEFYVDRYGNYSPIKGVLFSGSMGQRRVGDILPTNYQPQ